MYESGRLLFLHKPRVLRHRFRAVIIGNPKCVLTKERHELVFRGSTVAVDASAWRDGRGSKHRVAIDETGRCGRKAHAVGQVWRKP